MRIHGTLVTDGIIHMLMPGSPLSSLNASGPGYYHTERCYPQTPNTGILRNLRVNLGKKNGAQVHVALLRGDRRINWSQSVRYWHTRQNGNLACHQVTGNTFLSKCVKLWNILYQYMKLDLAVFYWDKDEKGLSAHSCLITSILYWVKKQLRALSEMINSHRWNRTPAFNLERGLKWERGLLFIATLHII